MGMIVCSNSKSLKICKPPQIIPPDYQTQLGESPITFKIIISNVKLKNSPFDENQVLIEVDKIKEILTPVIQNCFDPHWKIHEKFDYVNTQENLKTSFFKLTVFYYANKTRKIFSQVQFNLWDVAIGPIHHDLFLETKVVQNKTRITFDLNMVQLVRLNITTRSLKCDLNDQLIEKAYNFQLRIKSHKLDYESILSPNYVNPQYQWLNNNFKNSLQDEPISPSTQQPIIQESIGDLKLIKDCQVYEINDLYAQYDHDKDMDESEKKNPSNDNVNDMLKKKQLHTAKIRRVQSNSNLSHLIKSRPMVTQQPFSQQTLNQHIMQHPLKNASHLSQSMQNLERPLSGYFALTAKRDLVWQFRVDQEDIPHIEFDIYVDEFTTSTFEFILWGNKNPEELAEMFQAIHTNEHLHNLHIFQFSRQESAMMRPSLKTTTPLSKMVMLTKRDSEEKQSDDVSSNQSLGHYIDHKLIGHQFISMNRFCSADVSCLAEVGSMLVQEVRFEDKLQKHGVQIGLVQGEFIMTNRPFLRQMMGAIKTEQGIQKASLLYIRKDKYTTNTCSQVNKIIQINLQLDGLIGNLNPKCTTHRERTRINEQIAETLRELNAQLDGSQEQLYRNEEELNKAQQVLTDLAKSLLENADMVDEHLRSQYYELLIKLLHRQEFQLQYMGFDKRQMELFTCKNQPQAQKLCKLELAFQDQKIRMSLHYQSFLYKTLEIVFKKIQQRGSNQFENQFVYHFLVEAYFKIPQFQEQLLHTLINEGRTLDKAQDKSLVAPPPNLVISNDYFLFSFEWQKQFYDIISTVSRGQDHLRFIQQVLSQVNWGRIVHKQNYVFLKFITSLCRDVKSYKGAKWFIPWDAIPGYGVLVKVFLQELKDCDQIPYPEIFRDVSDALLENETLLNQFLLVIYSKTRIYDSLSVFYTYDMICFWFETLKSKNKKVPTDFNFVFFMKGIYLIFDGEHALSIAKAIHIIYIIFPQLPIEIQREFCERTFEKYFFKFFMFWSKTVRWVFHQFLIFRIQHLFRNLKTDSNKVRDLQKEFQYIKAKNEGKSSIHDKENLINDMIYLKYSQMVEIVVKMKKVLSKSMQQQDKNLLQAQLEAHSWKLKLIKKKMYRRRKRKSSESPVQEQSIDFTIQSLRSSMNSLTFHQNSESVQYQSENDLEKGFISQRNMVEQNNPQDDAYYEQLLDERSIGSILNLDEILQEIALERNEKQMKSSRVQKRISSVGNSEFKDHTNDIEVDNKFKKSPKKVTIYHRMNHFGGNHTKLEIPKFLLRYLIPAMTEWQEQQSNYKRWFMQKRGELVRMRFSEDELFKRLMAIQPPDINLRVPKDESESNVNEEW